MRARHGNAKKEPGTIETDREEAEEPPRNKKASNETSHRPTLMESHGEVADNDGRHNDSDEGGAGGEDATPTNSKKKKAEKKKAEGEKTEEDNLRCCTGFGAEATKGGEEVMEGMPVLRIHRRRGRRQVVRGLRLAR